MDSLKAYFQKLDDMPIEELVQYLKSIGIEVNEEYVKIGLRRLDLPSDYHEDDLIKEKKRKTTNSSKKSRVMAI